MQLIIEYLPHYRLKEWGELSYQHSHDSGFDLRAALETPFILAPKERALIPAGIKCALKPESTDLPCFSYEIQTRPRSGLALKQGLSLVNTPGTIDFNYRGEIKIMLINLGDKPVTIQPGDRIAQAVVCPVIHVSFTPGTICQETERGAGGFGSTGLA